MDMAGVALLRQVLPESSFYGTALNRLKCRRLALKDKVDSQAHAHAQRGHVESAEKDLSPGQPISGDTARALEKRLDELSAVVASLSANDLRQSQRHDNNVFGIAESIAERVEAALRRENETLRVSLEAKVDPLSRIAERVDAVLQRDHGTSDAPREPKVDSLSQIIERVDMAVQRESEALRAILEAKVASLARSTERVDMAVQRESEALRAILEAKVTSLAQSTERVDMALHRESETLRATIEAKVDSLVRTTAQVDTTLRHENASLQATLQDKFASLVRLNDLFKAADHVPYELAEESLRDARKHIVHLEEIASGLAERYDRLETQFRETLRCEVATLEEKRQVEHDALKTFIGTAITHSSLNASLDSLEAKLSTLITESQNDLKSLVSKATSNEGAVIAVPLENTVTAKCDTPLHQGADDLVSSLEAQNNRIVSSLDEKPLTGIVRRAATALDRRALESSERRDYSHDAEASVPANVLEVCDHQAHPAHSSNTPVAPNRLSAFLESFSTNNDDFGSKMSQRNFGKNSTAILPQPRQAPQSDEAAPSNRLAHFLATFTGSNSRNYLKNSVA